MRSLSDRASDEVSRLEWYSIARLSYKNLDFLKRFLDAEKIFRKSGDF